MLFALPFVAAGGYIMAISLGILPSDPEAFKAPRLVVAAAGAVFVLGGLMVLLQGSFSAGGQQTTLYKWLEFFVLGGFLLAFAGIFLWVGFGPGERAFQTETTLGPVTTTGDGSPLMGRCLFGTFGLGTLIAALLFIYKKLITLPLGNDEHLK
jgi:hypothetical protein